MTIPIEFLVNILCIILAPEKNLRLFTGKAKAANNVTNSLIVFKSVTYFQRCRYAALFLAICFD